MEENTNVCDKETLAEMLVDDFGKTKTEAKKIIEAVVHVIGDNLKAGTEVSLFGLGSFKVVPVAEKKGRNIQTGEPVVYPASHKVKFSAAKPIKDAVKAL